MTPLFILPFDHRSSLAKELLGVDGPLTSKERRRMIEFRAIVFRGFLEARSAYKGEGALGVLVDEEFGAAVLQKASKMHIPFAMTMEASSRKSFTFDRSDWRSRLTTRQPTFAKALVHYIPGDETHNALSRVRLRQLSQFCEKHGIDFMLEVLTGEHQGRKHEEAIKRALKELRDDGICPSLWKLEGLSDAAAWKRIARVAQAPIIVLGRAAPRREVDQWVVAAAKSANVLGFAIGRTIFLQALKDYIAHRCTKSEAEAKIAQNFLHFLHVWQKAAH